MLYTDASNRVISYAPEIEDSADTQISIASASIDVTEVPELVPTPEPTTPVVTPEPEVIEEVPEEVIEVQQEEPEVIEEAVVEDVSNEASEEVVEPELINLPYLRSIFREDEDWVLGYGGLSFANEQLVIGGANDTASLALLNNTTHFANYQMDVNLDWNRGASFSLVARFADYGNYVTCQFLQSASQVSIISVVDGERINETASPGLRTRNFEGWRDLNLGIKVVDSTVSCLKDGEVVLSKKVNAISPNGGAGLAIWGKVPGDALAHIKEVRINETN